MTKTTPRPFSAADLEALRAWDTPTICNALEVVVPHRRGHGFTVRPFQVADVALKPMCGLARTGTVRAAYPAGRTKEADRASRLGWYEYVATAAMPTVVVLQDLDEVPGTGAFWGEVNSNVHKSLGAQGCVTNGSFRDLDVLAPGFQILGVVNPSHAHVHVVARELDVTVHGMAVPHDAVIHADRHGAVVIPDEAVGKLLAAIDLLTRKEAVILGLCKSGKMSIEALRDAFSKMDDIH